MIARHRALGLPSGILIANPSPRPTRWRRTLINERIEQAVAEAQSTGWRARS